MKSKQCKQCGWVSKEHHSMAQAEQALNMHVSRKHGNLKGNPRIWIKAKRKYTKRAKSEPVGIGFCPHCGFNLALISAAMRMVS